MKQKLNVIFDDILKDLLADNYLLIQNRMVVVWNGHTSSSIFPFLIVRFWKQNQTETNKNKTILLRQFC